MKKDLIWRKINCKLCGATSESLLYQIGPYRIVKCKECGFIYLNPQPIVVEEEIYQEGYFRGAVENPDTINVNGYDYFCSDRHQKKVDASNYYLDKIERMAHKGRILDVGCGPGIFLKVAEERGWDCYGIEVSPFAARYAIDQLGLKVKCSSLEQADLPKDFFDVVTLFHVIEHLREPLDVMHKVHKILKEEGLLVIETPDISSGRARRAKERWEHIRLPEHLYYYSKRTLVKLLEMTSFRPIKVEKRVGGTGLMIAACGGQEKAKAFYDVWYKKKWFRIAVDSVRRMKEFISGTLLGDYDHITVYARKA